MQENIVVADHRNILLRDVVRQSEEEVVVENPLVDVIHADNAENFRNLLIQCCVDMSINHVQIRALLRVLRTHKCFEKLPKDSRTLLKTGRNRINFLPVGSGVYWHIGFVQPLQQQLLFYEDNELPASLELELSTDGLSLSRINPTQFWPTSNL